MPVVKARSIGRLGIPLFLTLVLLMSASSAIADDATTPQSSSEDSAPAPRATLQERFAPKTGRYSAHLGATAIIRDDFYHSPGYGLDLGYYFNETFGVELRGHNLHSRLTAGGERLRDEQGLVPDLRAPDAKFALGVRASWGYGKILTMDRFVVHFDPQWILHGGITLAEERVVPTVSTGIGFLTHWQYGIQVKLDLQMNFHFEQRERGLVPAMGFIPTLAVGWSPAGGDQ